MTQAVRAWKKIKKSLLTFFSCQHRREAREKLGIAMDAKALGRGVWNSGIETVLPSCTVYRGFVNREWRAPSLGTVCVLIISTELLCVVGVADE